MDRHGNVVPPGVLFLVICTVMGILFLFDVRGLATRVIQRADEQRFRLNERLPSWTPRAFGIYAIAFGVAQFFLFWRNSG